MHLPSSLGSFKTNIIKCLGFPSQNYLFYVVGECPASIFHTRLRLNFSKANYGLFKKNCSVSTVCTFCDAPIEDNKHNCLFCPNFAALYDILFFSAAYWLGVDGFWNLIRK